MCVGCFKNGNEPGKNENATKNASVEITCIIVFRLKK